MKCTVCGEELVVGQNYCYFCKSKVVFDKDTTVVHTKENIFDTINLLVKYVLENHIGKVVSFVIMLLILILIVCSVISNKIEKKEYEEVSNAISSQNYEQAYELLNKNCADLESYEDMKLWYQYYCCIGEYDLAGEVFLDAMEKLDSIINCGSHISKVEEIKDKISKSNKKRLNKLKVEYEELRKNLETTSLTTTKKEKVSELNSKDEGNEYTGVADFLTESFPYEYMDTAPEWVFENLIEEKYTVNVDGSTLNVRAGCGQEYDVIASLEDESIIVVIGTYDGWAYMVGYYEPGIGVIEYNNMKEEYGWISCEFLTETEVYYDEDSEYETDDEWTNYYNYNDYLYMDSAPEGTFNDAVASEYMVCVDGSTLNVREGCSFDSKIVGSLDDESIITVLGIYDGWAYIIGTYGIYDVSEDSYEETYGWVNAGFIEEFMG